MLLAAATGSAISLAGCNAEEVAGQFSDEGDPSSDEDGGPSDNDDAPTVQKAIVVVEDDAGEIRDVSVLLHFPPDTNPDELTPEFLTSLFASAPDRSSLSVPDEFVAAGDEAVVADLHVSNFVSASASASVLSKPVSDSSAVELQFPAMAVSDDAMWGEAVDVEVLLPNGLRLDLTGPNQFGGSEYDQFVDGDEFARGDDDRERTFLSTADGSEDREEFVPLESRDLLSARGRDELSRGLPEFTYLADGTVETLRRLAETKRSLASNSREPFDPAYYFQGMNEETRETIAETLSVAVTSGISAPVAAPSRMSGLASLTAKSYEQYAAFESMDELAAHESTLGESIEQAIGAGVTDSQWLRYLVRVPTIGTPYEGYESDKSPCLQQLVFLSFMEANDYLPLVQTAEDGAELLELVRSYHENLDEQLGVVRSLKAFTDDYRVGSSEPYFTHLHGFATSLFSYLEAYVELGYAWSWRVLNAAGEAPPDTRGVVNSAFELRPISHDWPQLNFSERRDSFTTATLGPTDEPGVAGFVSTDSRVAAAPVIGDGTIYAVTEAGRVRAIDGESLEPIWSTDLDESVYWSPAIVDGTLYVGTDDGTLVSIEAASGDVNWTRTLSGSEGLNNPVVLDAGVAVATDDNQLFVYDAAGRERWTVEEAAFRFGGSILGLAADADRLYAANERRNRVRAYDQRDGSLLWETDLPTDDNFVSRPALGPNGDLYVGTDGFVVSLDAASGSTRWTFESDAYNDIGAVTPELVYTADPVQVLDTATGERQWAHGIDTDTYRVAVTGENVFVVENAEDGSAYAFDREGRQRWQFPTVGDETPSPFALTDDRLVFGQGTKLYVLG